MSALQPTSNQYAKCKLKTNKSSTISEFLPLSPANSIQFNSIQLNSFWTELTTRVALPRLIVWDFFGDTFWNMSSCNAHQKISNYWKILVWRFASLKKLGTIESWVFWPTLSLDISSRSHRKKNWNETIPLTPPSRTLRWPAQASSPKCFHSHFILSNWSTKRTLTIKTCLSRIMDGAGLLEPTAEPNIHQILGRYPHDNRPVKWAFVSRSKARRPGYRHQTCLCLSIFNL